MAVAFHIEPSLVASLQNNPDRTLTGSMAGLAGMQDAKYTARVVISDYRRRISAHFENELKGRSLSELAEQLKAPLNFRHFGLVLSFEQPTNIVLNDADGVLNSQLRSLVDSFGPIVLHRAKLDDVFRQQEQRNIFPHLKFHYDRSALQESQISLFSRDPEDERQRLPRTSSTLFMPNVVAWLQSVREGLFPGDESPELRPSYDLFAHENVRDLFGNVVLEQPWNEPEGTAELCVIDNRTVLHASFHGDLQGKGWPIGTRYLI